jgi:hypothetical protein
LRGKQFILTPAKFSGNDEIPQSINEILEALRRQSGAPVWIKKKPNPGMISPNCHGGGAPPRPALLPSAPTRTHTGPRQMVPFAFRKHQEDSQ